MVEASRSTLLFFSNTLRLRRDDDGDAPEFRLARYLIEFGRDGGSAGSIQALWRPDVRLRRATLLLDRVLTTQQQRAPSSECWPILRREWEWVRSSAAVHGLLIAYAREIGISEPDTSVDRVLAAINYELIPLVRLRGVFFEAARTSISRDLAEMMTWAIPDLILRDVGPLYVQLLRIGIGASVAVNDAVHDNVRRLMPVAVEQQFATPLLSAYIAMAGQPPAPEPAEHQCASLLEKVRAVEAVAPPDVNLLMLFSSLQLATGVAKVKDTVGEDDGIELIAWAALYNPFSDNPRQRLEECAEIRKQLKDLRPTFPQSVPALTEKLKRFETGLRRAKDVQSSQRAEQIGARWTDALLREFAKRNGWNADDEQDLIRATSAVNAINQAANEVLAEVRSATIETVISRAREIAAEDSLDSALPWDLWQVRLSRVSIWRGELLGILLDPIEAAPKTEEVAVIANAARIDDVPRSHRRAFAGAWAWSRIDWPAKVAAAIGTILVLHAIAAGMIQSTERAVTEQAYLSVVNAVRGSDADKVLAAAPAFLTAAKARDPRCDQVATIYSEALFREVLRLSEANHASEAAALLAAYREVASRHRQFFDSNEQEVVR